MKRVTIYEVAKEADVSLATVSRVINGSNVVKEATRKRVEDAINKLGYRPNAIAQGLALQRSTTIGLIVPEASFVYIGQIINGLSDVAKIYDYNIILHTVTEGITNIREVVDEVIKSRVDGVIIYCDRKLDDSTKLLEEYNIPMVVMGTDISSDSICSVFIDYERAVHDLCASYLKKGIKDITVVEDRRNDVISEEMKEGARKAFEEAGEKFESYLAIPKGSRSTYKYLRKSLKKSHKGLFIANRDSQAMAILNVAKENGLSIPEDVEIVCMTDTKYKSMARPEISAFIMPSYDLGAVSMRLMTKMMNGEEVEEKEKCLGFLYQERKSTKKEAVV